MDIDFATALFFFETMIEVIQKSSDFLWIFWVVGLDCDGGKRFCLIIFHAAAAAAASFPID